jgi:undecaprenyl pyrophosphate synthase
MIQRIIIVIIITNSALVEEYEICVRFLGKTDQLPKEVQEVMQTVIEKTKHHKKYGME